MLKKIRQPKPLESIDRQPPVLCLSRLADGIPGPGVDSISDMAAPRSRENCRIQKQFCEAGSRAYFHFNPYLIPRGLPQGRSFEVYFEKRILLKSGLRVKYFNPGLKDLVFR
jgi:hypothetical protein